MKPRIDYQRAAEKLVATSKGEIVTKENIRKICLNGEILSFNIGNAITGLNRKLKPMGFVLTNVRSFGYRLDALDQEEVEESTEDVKEDIMYKTDFKGVARALHMTYSNRTISKVKLADMCSYAEVKKIEDWGELLDAINVELNQRGYEIKFSYMDVNEFVIKPLVIEKENGESEDEDKPQDQKVEPKAPNKPKTEKQLLSENTPEETEDISKESAKDELQEECMASRGIEPVKESLPAKAKTIDLVDIFSVVEQDHTKIDALNSLINPLGYKAIVKVIIVPEEE